VKILKFWKTELSYAQNKNRSKKMRLLGMDTCPSLKISTLSWWWRRKRRRRRRRRRSLFGCNYD
jgi:hypothetical protein